MSNHIQARTDFFILSQLPKPVNLFLRFILSLVNKEAESRTVLPLCVAINPSPTYRIESILKFCRPAKTTVL